MELNEEQKSIVQDFIKEFLPPTGNKRKARTNEIQFIAPTLNSIFNKHFKFKVDEKDLLDIFDEMDYQIFIKGNVFDSSKKDLVPAKETKKEGWNRKVNLHANQVYVEVHSVVVSALRLVNMTLAENTNPIKVKETESYRKKVHEFVDKIGDPAAPSVSLVV